MLAGFAIGEGIGAAASWFGAPLLFKPGYSLPGAVAAQPQDRAKAFLNNEVCWHTGYHPGLQQFVWQAPVQHYGLMILSSVAMKIARKCGAPKGVSVPVLGRIRLG